MRAISETRIVSRPQPLRSLSRLLCCIRFDEVLVLQGAPLIGAVFSIGALTVANICTGAVVAVASICLVAHIFVLNDWAGVDGDLRDPNRAAKVFSSKGVNRTAIGLLAVALLAFSLLILALVNVVLLALGVAIASLSWLYSSPVLHLKGVPVFNSALHFFGGTLHFLLGYAIFAGVDLRGLVIGCFFGLVFTAGHLTHEARDYDADLANGIRTNAVAFGRTQSVLAGLFLFTAAYGLLIALAAFGTVPRALLLASVLYPVHFCASLRTLSVALTVESLCRLQRYYRALYAIIGIMMVVTALMT
jgi:4-hydroxybenzoate polyprenyltransferase